MRLSVPLFLALIAAQTLPVPFAYADERTAGRKTESARPIESAPSGPPRHAALSDSERRAAPKNASMFPSSPASQAAAESTGLLFEAGERGLGLDLWRGSKRSVVVDMLARLPANAPYRTLQLLDRRLLLTGADTTLMRRDSKVTQERDILTLRLEKLLEAGAYKEAFALYARAGILPAAEPLARVGVLTAFYDRQPAIACLETQALGTQFQDVVFWQQAQKICTALLLKISSSASSRKSTDDALPDSSILRKIATSRTYRFAPRRIQDLAILTPLETALLAGMERIDLSGFAAPDTPDTLPPHVLALLAETPGLPDEIRFSFLRTAVAKGLALPEALALFYVEKAPEKNGGTLRETSLSAYRTLRGWRRLPYLYAALGDAAKDAEQARILSEALALAPEYGTVALWPFASALEIADPRTISPKALPTAVSVLLETGRPVSESWAARRFSVSAVPSRGAALAYAAAAIQGTALPDIPTLAESLENLTSQEQRLVDFVAEKLDKSKKLHNFSGKLPYGTEGGLTSPEDYVMQSDGLMKSLADAAKDKRTGEVVLLSSILLHEAPSDEIRGAVLPEVLDGLLSVGLVEEARSLSREVILGLNEKK